jgi:hypothetical protein
MNDELVLLRNLRQETLLQYLPAELLNELSLFRCFKHEGCSEWGITINRKKQGVWYKYDWNGKMCRYDTYEDDKRNGSFWMNNISAYMRGDLTICARGEYKDDYIVWQETIDILGKVFNRTDYVKRDGRKIRFETHFNKDGTRWTRERTSWI